MINRTTPENITALKENEVFVFGSNTKGHHNGGAARAAVLKFGAIYGQAEGFQGRSYAIPTVNLNMTGAFQLELATINNHVDFFIRYVRQFTGVPAIFLVTEIGCGIAGFSTEQIAPLFKETVEINNIHLPKSFWRVLNKIS